MKIRTAYFRIVAIFVACIVFLQVTGCTAYSTGLNKETFLPFTSQDSFGASQKISPSSAVPSAASEPIASSKDSAISSDFLKDTVSKAQIPRMISATEGLQDIKRMSVQKAAASSADYTAITQDSGYFALKTDAERTLYELIGNSVYQVAVSKTSSGFAPTGQISIPTKLTEAQIRLTITAYLDDHPQVFWIANAYSYGYRNDHTIVQMYSQLAQSECNAAVIAFNGKVQSIIQSIPTGLSEFDREEYLFHYIIKNCSYDDAAAQNSDNWKAYTAYGALVEGKAVCEGYSRAMLLLGGYVGLSGVLIRGTGQGVAHMWNGIQIDGNWCHLDLTWSDNSNLIYNYFNVDDATLKLTHTIAPVFSSLTDEQICSSDSVYNLMLPVCSSRAENYFLKKGIAISTLDDTGDEAVVSAIAIHMKSQQETIAFRIDSGDYDSTVQHMVSAKPYKLAVYLQRAATQAGVQLKWKGISYVTDKANNGLNVFVSYS